MREIKFRVWDKSSSQMSIETISLSDWGDYLIDFKDGAVDVAADYVVWLQYTGLKDKNGMEIYEGDVIRVKHDDGRYDIGNIVYGSKGAFCLHLPNVGTGIKTPLLNYIHGIMFAEFDFEVIGNIYEHPELLEANQ